ncbi:hypothetical protein AVEN_228304-1 [Araneus ventricosus]|uniref:Uncharacterized protein n=1 Tax=Araneus ventricosus TaxID=182803 RepID=A0A4Y2IIQ0_ARAVE|nr:hypothetical protein AVEN_228304-1 [Araneus ventricosus]
MSQQSDLLKRRRNRVAAQRQISEKKKSEKKERVEQLRKERAKRYYEKNKQKKNFITNYFQMNEGASTSGVKQRALTSITFCFLLEENPNQNHESVT